MTLPAKRRSPALDGVRGFALLIVVIHNTAWISGPSEQLLVKLYAAGAAAGWVGVQLFFVLSGFLITGILMDTRRSPDYLRRFFIRRALRIFPLYFVGIAIAVLLAATLAQNTDWANSVDRYQWAYWTYVSNWTDPFTGGIPGLSHLWSLAIEEQFYFLWPLAVWRTPSHKILRILVALVAAAPLMRFGMIAAGMPPITSYSFTIARVDALAIGALLALCLQDDRLRIQLFRWLPAITAVSTSVLGALAFHQRGLHALESPVLIYGQTLTAVLSACLIAWTQKDPVSGGGKMSRIMTNGLLRDLGKYSYAIYLIHAPLHAVFNEYATPIVRASDGPLHLPRLLAYTVFVLALSYGASRITWLILEQPALRLKDRLTRAS